MERAVLLYTTWLSIVEAEQVGREMVASPARRLRQRSSGDDLTLLVEGRDRSGLPPLDHGRDFPKRSSPGLTGRRHT
jgi:hypothetical protein